MESLSSSLGKLSPELLNFPLSTYVKGSLPLKELIKFDKNVLVFVRHFNWFVCRDFVVALSKVTPKFQQNGIGLFVIGCSPADRIASFAKDTGFNQQDIYTDPKKEIYNALGLIEAKNFSEIKGKGEKSKESVSGVVKGFAWSIYKSIWHSSKNVYQLGGTLIVDNQNNILFKKVDTSSEDHAGVDQLMKEAGI